MVVVLLHEAFHGDEVSVEQDGLCDRGIWVLWQAAGLLMFAVMFELEFPGVAQAEGSNIARLIAALEKVFIVCVPSYSLS